MSQKEKASRVEASLDHLKLKLKEKLNLFDTVIIYPFLGYSNSIRSVISGRILEQEAEVHTSGNNGSTIWANIKKVFKRYESDEIPFVQLSATLAGKKVNAYANEEGYFEFEFYHQPGELSNGWHKVAIEIESIPYDVECISYAEGEILVCDQSADFGVISDVDDTIIQSFATNPVKKLYTLLTQNSESRTPFEGVEELYHLLVNKNKNPLFFVSGSSFNLYDLLIKFCKHHNIPKAPFLLRNLGLENDKWFKQNTDKYKKSYVEEIFQMYPELEFILIGDSGQKDPEIYTSLCEKYPNQVKAIYIRHVRDEARLKEISAMGQKVSADFLVMNHSFDAIQHLKNKALV
ncbi:App1 family protein [Fulvivirga sediminis]|uniref:DUF2183 domain-containing protein n=1 Tax=Fulvivirga sediminis TaxID=2803949 RepID=A0A937K0M1_9BACT|nr:phosphatase domain-containing protein [Fulvivirga sediminis]MBL3658493.1 DUF2183 domain-containing protein [Fulvivirga sediminis]